MRKLAVVFFCFMSTQVLSQDAISDSSRRNELGVDITSLIKFYINFSSNGDPFYYQPNYILSYRFHFKRGNIRTAAGGSYYLVEVPSTDPTNNRVVRSRENSIAGRIGYEFYNNISKRWQVFYGIDYRHSYSYAKHDITFQNAGYENGVEGKIENFGVAPLLGFRWRINHRLSILTESSFQVNIAKHWERRFYTPVDNTFPSKPDDPIRKWKTTSTVFLWPVSLYLTVDI